MNKEALAHALLEQLSRNSTPYQDPLTRINWQSLDQDMFWLPEQAISLYGLKEYNDLPNSQRRALSQYEFLNYVEAALWLESLFVERISRNVREVRHRQARHIYRLHKLREEAGHLLVFSELMHRSGLILPNTRFHHHQLIKLISQFAPFEGLAFWITMLIAEEIPDRMNRYIRKHAKGICPAVFDIVSIHIIEETRHIAHAHETLDENFYHCSNLERMALKQLANYLFKQMVNIFYFPPARVYELAGLNPGKKWAKAARTNKHRLRFVDECVSSTLRVLKENKIDIKRHNNARI